MQIPPPGWRKDKLSEFIDVATDNTFATFHNKKAEYELLRRVDSCFELIIPNLINRPEIVPAMLLARAHSTYRAAVRLAVSGQCPEAFSLLRTAIECSMYAFRMYRHPELVELWLNRHKDESSLKSARSMFSYGKALTTLNAVDKKQAERLDALYQRCIDFGAHPNEMSVTGNMEINELEKAKAFLQKYLVGDDVTFAHGLKSTAQIGVGILCVFRLIFKERFDLLDVTNELAKLREKL